ncbi:hypothetical protein ACRAQ6_13905 [Erythrobacter sp. HA6-11]
MKSEFAAGWVDVFKDLGAWIDEKPRRAGFSIAAALLTIGVAVFIWKFEDFARWMDNQQGGVLARRLSEDQRIREGKQVDGLIAREVLQLRLRTGTARSVARAYVFDVNERAQIIGVTDVFESMDPLAERTGIRQTPLPLDDISDSVAFMLSDPSNPQCIARNSDEYENAGLRNFLARAGLKSSAACPITGLDGEPLGLLAVSARTPLERNPELARQVRDTALMLSGYWLRSPRVQTAISDFRETGQ